MTLTERIAARQSVTSDVPTACSVCGIPSVDCTVGGLHGMLRERANLAARSTVTVSPFTRRALPAKDMTRA